MSVKKPVTKKSVTKKSAAKSPANKPVTKKSAAKSPANKPAPAKAPARPPKASAGSAAADDELHGTAYVLPALAARTAPGPALTVAQAMVYIDVPSEQLVTAGQSVRTERINLDTARIYGTAYDFYQAATPQQRAAVPGLTLQRLRVSIWAAAQGEAKNRAVLDIEERRAAEQGYRATDAAQVKDQARGVREVLHATLFALTGGQRLRVDELNTAYGRSADPKDLAKSLTALADLYDRYHGDPDPKITGRRAEMALDGTLAKRARDLAQQVLLRGSAMRAPRTATSNGEVDLWDGINLHLLDQLITLFEAGHRLDPTVPRLLPLSLRGWFGRSRPKAASEDPPQSDPAPSQPAG